MVTLGIENMNVVHLCWVISLGRPLSIQAVKIMAAYIFFILLFSCHKICDIFLFYVGVYFPKILFCMKICSFAGIGNLALFFVL